MLRHPFYEQVRDYAAECDHPVRNGDVLDGGAGVLARVLRERRSVRAQR